MIFGAYRKTLFHESEEGGFAADLISIVAQIVAPFVLSFVAICFGARVGHDGSVVSVVSMASGWMCATAVFLFELRKSSMKDDKRLVRRDRESVSELFYLAVWLSSFGLALSVFFILVSSIELPNGGLAEILISFAILFGIMHFSAAFIGFLQRLLMLFYRISERR